MIQAKPSGRAPPPDAKRCCGLGARGKGMEWWDDTNIEEIAAVIIAVASVLAAIFWLWGSLIRLPPFPDTEVSPKLIVERAYRVLRTASLVKRNRCALCRNCRASTLYVVGIALCSTAGVGPIWSRGAHRAGRSRRKRTGLAARAWAVGAVATGRTRTARPPARPSPHRARSALRQLMRFRCSGRSRPRPWRVLCCAVKRKCAPLVRFDARRRSVYLSVPVRQVCDGR